LNITQLRSVNQLQPVSSLPTELLGYIFELACRNVALSIDSISKSVLMMRKTRNAISLTCFRWREAALSTSVLWRAITIMNMNDVRHLTDPDRFLAYIERAKYRKLVAFLCPPAGQTFWEELQDHLLPVLSRCETIISSDPHIHTLSPAFTTTHWAALKSLVIKWGACRLVAPHTINLTSAHSLESLWVLCSAGAMGPPGTLTFRVPSASAITRLSLEGGYICSLSLIRSCPQLKLLQWSSPLHYDPHDHMEPTKTESLPNLLQLSVRGELPTWFMTRLAAPNLDHLVYTWEYSLRDTQSPFQNPSQFPNLRFLEVDGFPISSVSMLLAPFLRTHEKLQRLHLPWCLTVERDLLEVLGSISTLPNLEYIRMGDGPGFTAAEALLEQRVPQNPVQDGQHEKAKKFTLHLRHGLPFSDDATRLTERFGDSVCCEWYISDSDPWSWPIEV